MPNAYTGRVTALNPATHDMVLRITVSQSCLVKTSVLL